MDHVSLILALLLVVVLLLVVMAGVWKSLNAINSLKASQTMTFKDIQDSIAAAAASATAAEQRATEAQASQSAQIQSLSQQVSELQAQLSNNPSPADVDAAVTTLGQVKAGLDALDPATPAA